MRTNSLSDAEDETSRVFSVHYHTAYASSTPTQHVVRVGLQAGVHMCSCLELAHRGLPCRHYFAVLLHDQSIQFDVDVIHPRWFTHPTRSSLPPCCDDTPRLHSAAHAERLKVIQYLSMDATRHKIEQLAGDVRGLKSKAEYAERLISLESDLNRKSQAALFSLQRHKQIGLQIRLTVLGNTTQVQMVTAWMLWTGEFVHALQTLDEVTSYCCLYWHVCS